MFDFTVHMGDVIAIVGGIVTLMIFMFRMEGKLDAIGAERKMEAQMHSSKFTALEKGMEKLADCLVQLARQEERIDALDGKIESVIDIVCPRAKAKAQSRSKM